ncbi:MAG: GNAT family N-acetyltransferase [Pseudomonadota bacterium]
MGTPDDALPVSRLIHRVSAAFLRHPDGQGAEAFFASISEAALRVHLSAPNMAYLLLERGGDLTGVVGVRDHAHLYHLFVDPACQGQGWGRALWERARDHALLQARTSTFTVNASVMAVPVYERFGFVRHAAPVEARGVVFVPMRLTLAPVPTTASIPTGASSSGRLSG